MGEIVVILASFILGMVATLIILGVWTFFLYKKQNKEKIKVTEELDKAKSGYASVKERLNKVRELTKVQMTLSSQVEIPQKNSLDGKFKNSFSKEVKKIEEEKAVILRSILADGYDPEVSTLGDSGTETMKLSQFLGSINSKESATIVPIKKESKFSVLKGGKLSEAEMDKILDENNDDKKDN